MLSLSSAIETDTCSRLSRCSTITTASAPQVNSIFLIRLPSSIAHAVKTWLEMVRVQTHYIEPASPWQNAFGESFNGTLRREHLNRELFATVDDARVRTETWRRYYNNERRHTRLGYRTPQHYFEQTAAVHPSALGALPSNPQDLPHPADPVGKENEAKHAAPPHPTVFGPAAALRWLPSVALSSGRASISLPQQSRVPKPDY